MAILTLEDKVKKQVQTAGKSLLDELRSVTNPKKKGRARMAVDELTDPHLLEMYFWMMHGKTDHWLAKRILKWGYHPEREVNNWRKMVRTFRDRALPLLKNTANLKDKPTKDVVYKQRARARRVVEAVDALKVLHETLAIQKERAEMLLDLERAMLLPWEDEAQQFSMALKEVWAAYFGAQSVNEALNSLARTAERTLEQERKLGIRDNTPSEATIHIQHRFDGFLEHVVTNDGQMLVEGVHRLFDTMEEKSVLLARGTDGQWTLEDGGGDENPQEDD